MEQLAAQQAAVGEEDEVFNEDLAGEAVDEVLTKPESMQGQSVDDESNKRGEDELVEFEAPRKPGLGFGTSSPRNLDEIRKKKPGVEKTPELEARGRSSTRERQGTVGLGHAFEVAKKKKAADEASQRQQGEAQDVTSTKKAVTPKVGILKPGAHAKAKAAEEEAAARKAAEEEAAARKAAEEEEAARKAAEEEEAARNAAEEEQEAAEGD